MQSVASWLYMAVRKDATSFSKSIPILASPHQEGRYMKWFWAVFTAIEMGFPSVSLTCLLGRVSLATPRRRGSYRNHQVFSSMAISCQHIICECFEGCLWTKELNVEEVCFRTGNSHASKFKQQIDQNAGVDCLNANLGA
jgi:hypothetical protein